jgi:hypothetical protein
MILRFLPLSRLPATILTDNGRVSRWEYEALQHCIALGLSVKKVVALQTEPMASHHTLADYFWCNRLKRTETHRNQQIDLVNHVVADVLPCTPVKTTEGYLLDEVVNQTIAQDSNVIISFSRHEWHTSLSRHVNFGLLYYDKGSLNKLSSKTHFFNELQDEAPHTSIRLTHLQDNEFTYIEAKAYTHRHSLTLSTSSLLEHASLLLSKVLYTVLIDKKLSRLREKEQPVKAISLTRYFGLFLKQISHTLSGKFFAAFTDMRWTIARSNQPLNLYDHQCLQAQQTYPIPKDMLFIADPIVIDQHRIVCEGLEKKSNLGVLLCLDGNQVTQLKDINKQIGDKHLSYPFIVKTSTQIYLLPEIAQAGAQRIFPIDNEQTLSLSTGEILTGLEDKRLNDATLFFYDNTYWLFATQAGLTANSVLYLWYAESLTGNYMAHPENPIRIDPNGGRPAGPIYCRDGKLYRMGQNNCHLYGNGVSVFEINMLSKTRYHETQIGHITAKHHYGPHTIDIQQGDIIFDHYCRRFNLFAWLYKLRNKAAK